MACKRIIKDEIDSKFTYCPKSGEIRWLHSSGPAAAGDIAGSKNKEGRITLNFNYKRVYASRVAWVLFYGENPDGDIDHINGNPSDNRIDNLRIVNKTQNSWNSKTPANNTSGAKGASFHRDANKWRACIRINGKLKHLGLFNEKEDAIASYNDAANVLHKDYRRAA